MIDLKPWDAQWPAVLNQLAPEFHPVDREAVLVWFEMFPLLTAEIERDRTFYQVKGQPSLAGQEDSTHAFLYGHRHWAAIKQACTQPQATLEATIRATAKASGAPLDFALGMAAIAWMTRRQSGDSFLSTPFTFTGPKESPDQFAARRLRPTGLLSRFLDRKPRVFFHKSGLEDNFPIIPTQDMATAAELDKRPWHTSDDRCYDGMGPIPVDCRSGSCGTCWVGVLDGNANLDPLTDYERRRMEYFGYWDSGFHNPDTDRPRLRLACQTSVQGNVAVVIPPWNGVYGKVRRERKTEDS